MDIIIKNKFFTLGGSSTVKTLDGSDIFKVKGRVFSFTAKKFIYDMNDNLIYLVRNKYWHLLTKSAIIYDSNKEEVLRIKRRISWKSRFKVLNSENDMRIDGNFIGWHFDIIKDEKVVATIRRKLNFVDEFVLHVDDDSFLGLGLAIVIAIDNIIDRERNDN